ncbi:hypothetical protein [Stutzerimonas nitrititolerans]|uniref:hypothetical protein n=1 Tax=Stutzerimonas nitrititolerans TaxID=2482751 RepID=UPI002899A6AF|nr:hypothetical protein [Stutzerimonas nitrititolerans]
MNWSVIKYLEWVFPVAIYSQEDHVTFENVRFDDPRDLITILYSKFLYLPELYFEEKQFAKVWDVVQGDSSSEEFDDLLANTIAEIAFDVGFVSRFSRIVVGYDKAACEFYWSLALNKSLAFWRAVYRYVGTNVAFMIKGVIT